jgi:hypothetical protein
MDSDLPEPYEALVVFAMELLQDEHEHCVPSA